jgi:hypothetical protein
VLSAGSVGTDVQQASWWAPDSIGVGHGVDRREPRAERERNANSLRAIESFGTAVRADRRSLVAGPSCPRAPPHVLSSLDRTQEIGGFESP